MLEFAITHLNYESLDGIEKALYSTVEPRYNEVGYNKILLQRGNFVGPSSLYFFVFLP